MNDPEWRTVGRRYSRRQASGALERIDHDAHHLLTGAAVVSMKAWAIASLTGAGVDVDAIIRRAVEQGRTNEGEAVRQHVASIVGTEPDDQCSLAARIFELCRLIELHRTDERVRRWIAARNGEFAIGFELGRLSMLAKVYGLDEQAIHKRVTGAQRENRKYTEADRAWWRQLRAGELGKMDSDRSAARVIAEREGLPAAAQESIRRAFKQKPGKT